MSEISMQPVSTLGIDSSLIKEVEPASAKLLAKLLILVRPPKFHVNVRRGYPTCNVCGYSVAKEVLEKGSDDESVVSANVVIPLDRGFFLFPILLHHYCKAHGLHVPGALIRAIEDVDIDNVDEQAIKSKYKQLKLSAQD